MEAGLDSGNNGANRLDVEKLVLGSLARCRVVGATVERSEYAADQDALADCVLSTPCRTAED